MNGRTIFAKYLIHIGSFIQSLAVVVMKPDDLIGFSRMSYDAPRSIDSWAEASLVDSGLSEDEQKALEYLPEKSGELLLLGVGGGREAIPLGRMGFNITAVD